VTVVATALMHVILRSGLTIGMWRSFQRTAWLRNT